MLHLLAVGALGGIIPTTDVANEVCPDDASENKMCTATQDFVLVIDVSYSRLAYANELRVFATKFADEIGLDDDDPYGPRLSIVTFHGLSVEPAATNEQSTTSTPLTSSRAAVNQAISQMTVEYPACTETGGCTCISCGIEVAWDLIPTDDRDGRGPDGQCATARSQRHTRRLAPCSPHTSLPQDVRPSSRSRHCPSATPSPPVPTHPPALPLPHAYNTGATLRRSSC